MPDTTKKRLLTGLQPSGSLHIGNYFGALRPFLELSKGYETVLMVADYHALTSLKDKQLLKENIINIVRDYIAAGINPADVVLFRQSDNQDHTEMAWVLNCMVTVPFLMQAHSYKDKVAKGLEANAGLFTYPMLMAADIVLYDTDVVPVGEDQRQHLEYTREAVTKFNHTFGENILKEPKEMIQTTVGVVPGTDGQKMSKSYKNTIPLFGTREDIQKAVMSIVTDSGNGVPTNVRALHALFRTENELDTLYSEHAGQYKSLKEALFEDVDAFVAPMRKKREAITDTDVLTILKDGAEKARAISSRTLTRVRDAIGINL